MKFIFFIMLLSTGNAFAIPVDVMLHNRMPANTTNSDVANVAIKAVTDIKEYYSKNVITECKPSKRVEFESEIVDLIKNKTLKKIKVSLYEDQGMFMVASFNEVETEVALNVELKNKRCTEFFFYKSITWSDPV